MDIRKDKDGDDLIIALDGEIDLRVWPQLDELAEELRGHEGPVIVDGSAITFCDSVALRFFVAVRSTVHDLRLRTPSRELEVVLDSAGLLDAFHRE